ncbi:MAG: ketoacyl-ACP synthase III [Lachnospiraceae bacterium]|nr:ketoacyl-ACP synthase III [Lachnospiraceae bacterium]
MKALKIIGAGYELPERRVTSEELETMMQFDKFGIRKGMSKLLSGVSERRFAKDDEDASDYAVRAGRKALDSAGLKPEDIDIVLFCSISSDFMEPATAMKVREDLKCINANCYDIKNACNAFLSGLEVANLYIETGRAKNILITSGEILSRYLRLNYDTPEEIANANATFSLGDAGGAVVVTAVDTENEDERLKNEFFTNSEYWHDGVLWGSGTHYAHDPGMAYFQNESKEMIKTNFARAMEYYKRMLVKYKINYDEVALFIPHQITKYLTQKTVEILGLPKDKTIDIVSNYGNIGCSSIPLAIAQNIENGVLKTGSGKRIVVFGFGNGISMGFFTLKI